MRQLTKKKNIYLNSLNSSGFFTSNSQYISGPTKMTKVINNKFAKEAIQMANKYMKPSLDLKEMQIKNSFFTYQVIKCCLFLITTQ